MAVDVQDHYRPDEDGDQAAGDEPAVDRSRSGQGGEKDDGKTDDREKDEDKPSPLANPKVRIALIVVAVLAALLLLAWYLHYRSYGQYQQSTNDAYLDAEQTTVSARVAGYVDQVLVTDNQLVRAGQMLVRIDPRTSAASAEQSLARIAEAQASVAQARASRTQQYDMIRQAQAQADQSRATLLQNQASDQFNAQQVARYAPLAAAGVETDERLAQNRSNLDQSRAQVASARAQLAAADAQVSSARHQIAINTAQIGSGEAQVAEARAQLAANQVDVEATTVTSRIAGRIGDRTVRVGQYVQIGTRLMTVVPVDRLYLTANFKETQIGLMRIGQPATIKVDALSGDEMHGTVESFSPGTGSRFAQVPVNNATGNFTKIVQRVPVRIRVDATDEARRVLVPGLSATVSVDTRAARDDKDARAEDERRTREARARQRRQELDRDQGRPRPGAGQ